MRTRRIISQAVVLAMAVAVVPAALSREARALTPGEVHTRLQAVQAELRDIGEKLERAGQEFEASLDAVAKHRQSLAEAEERRAELEETASVHAAQLYMLGASADFAAGDDVTEVADHVSYIEQIERSARVMLEELDALDVTAATETQRLNIALESAQDAREELEERRVQVSKRLRVLSRLYIALQKLDPRLAARASRAGVNGLVCPVEGPHVVLDNFGAPRPGGPHAGDDIDAETGQPVRAVLAARVIDTPRGGWIGIGIVIRDLAGNEWWYAHLDDSYVRRGQQVAAGEVIGRVGCTGTCYGSHLHFEYHPGGGSPVDPFQILSAAC